MPETSIPTEIADVEGVDMAASVEALEARALIHSMGDDVTEQVKAKFLEGRAAALAPPPEGAFQRLFEAIGNFIEELLSGCRAETLFGETRKLDGGPFRRRRKRKWRRAIVRKTRGEITDEAANAILDVGAEKTADDYRALQALQVRAQVFEG